RCSSSYHHEGVVLQLNHQRLHAQLCDCVVVVGGQSFQAHRSILAACSSHFRALLSSSDSTDESGGPAHEKSGSGGPSVMKLDPEVVTPEAFSTLLDMIYTSTLSLGCSNVMDVLLAASHLPGGELSFRCKRKLQEERLGGRKRSCRLFGEMFKECSPTVSRSAVSTEEGGEELLSPDSLKMPDGLWESPGGEDEVEKKYEATKAESEEIQLPSQSDSSSGGLNDWEKDETKNKEAVIKVKVGEEGEEEESKIKMIEVKKENLSSFSPELDPVPNDCGSSGATNFRRIAPKIPPGSEASADPSSSSGSGGDGVEHPPLTRASEDVLSKCKKAAAEDLVLLVEGEKKYACKICCKTFMNLTDCKKHIRVHTGEKPYPCPKCGKRFSQSSHLWFAYVNCKPSLWFYFPTMILLLNEMRTDITCNMRHKTFKTHDNK
uniref:Zinc finger and BTB domain containing 5 n=1 Tax=Sphaeramia orbicularis TaxID=375764 RepID=A0A672YND9_9TELE